MDKLDPIIEAFFEKEASNTEDWQRDMHEPIQELRGEIKRLEDELASVTFGDGAARRIAAIEKPLLAAIAEYQVREASMKRVIDRLQREAQHGGSSVAPMESP